MLSSNRVTTLCQSGEFTKGRPGGAALKFKRRFQAPAAAGGDFFLAALAAPFFRLMYRARRFRFSTLLYCLLITIFTFILRSDFVAPL
jgi:hypothetical protein